VGADLTPARALAIAALTIAALAAAPDGRAAPQTQTPPAALCKGCLFAAAKGERRPLLVLLHGDRQPPRRMIAAFRAAAARYDVALLAPPCPKEDGCDQRSFWRWNADPSWLAALVDRAVAAHDLDPDRVALVGWSGGATYLGKRMAELDDRDDRDDLDARYSAAILVGGGMPSPRCAKRTPMPVFLLQGDHNPNHPLAVALRESLLACGHEVQWHLVRGADHAAEWMALTRSSMQRQIFEFLDAHPRRAATSAPAPTPAAAPAAPLPDLPAR
jgi:poly(3-hydroxybutyrate) depolymerase